MTAATTHAVALALRELDQCVDAELAAVERLCSLALRAAEVRDPPLDADALIAMLVVVGGKAEMLRNDAGCLIDLVAKAAGLEGGAPCR